MCVSVRAVLAETPATLMLGVIKSNLEGKLPLVATLLAVRDALQRSADVYRPTAEGLKTQMEEAKNLDVSMHTHRHTHACKALMQARPHAHSVYMLRAVGLVLHAQEHACGMYAPMCSLQTEVRHAL